MYCTPNGLMLSYIIKACLFFPPHFSICQIHFSPTQYISKNVPATERVIRPATEGSFPASHNSSRSHNSSTRAHSSTHRHEERTWSLEHSDSILSDSPGMMSSSVGTSKCSSPACMDARARRAAHCGYSDPHRTGLHYGDSFDSLGDSPHSDRYVSALTTPARLSPVPTFQITSPNASHAMSLPPAVRNPYPLEDDQPLLRRYQVPLHDAQCQEPYRQQRRTYLNDSRGSLPSSPYRLAKEEDYETTQEYLSSREQPKRSGSSGTGSRRWRRSRLNGHVAPRGYEASRDYGSRSCLTDSESEEDGENTPFLSMQNMNAEPSTIYRPVDSRTSHSSGGTVGMGTCIQDLHTHAPNRTIHPLKSENEPTKINISSHTMEMLPGTSCHSLLFNFMTPPTPPDSHPRLKCLNTSPLH
ncbi:hypothetical protein F7725_006602, partial [Dissostichus mawsoni]